MNIFFHFITVNNNDNQSFFASQNSRLEFLKKKYEKNFNKNFEERKMDSSFAETIPNATIDTSLSEPQVGSVVCFIIYDVIIHGSWFNRTEWKFEFQDIDHLQNHGINAADLNKDSFHTASLNQRLWLVEILTNHRQPINFIENLQAQSCWHFDNKRPKDGYKEET